MHWGLLEAGEGNRFGRYLTEHKAWMDALVNGLNPTGEERVPDLASLAALVARSITQLPTLAPSLQLLLSAHRGETGPGSTGRWTARGT